MALPICTSALFSCEETLPPRNDPVDYLGSSLSGVSGVVVMQGDLSVISNDPGGLRVSVTNLHDEVLQAEENISIDLEVRSFGSSQTVATAHGTRDQLVDKHMIQNGNLLTIEPESSAVFFVQWDHADAALWNQTGLTFHTLPGNPADVSWFESGTINLQALGIAQLFTGIAPVDLDAAQFSISYTIFVGDPQEAQIDNFLALYDEDIAKVRLQWQTPFEVNNYGFKIERGTAPDEFPVVYEDFIPGQGTTPDTTYYSFVDSIDTSPGLRYYRLQRWYDFGFTIWPLEPSHPTAVIVP